jgi:hypothetical protein
LSVFLRTKKIKKTRKARKAKHKERKMLRITEKETFKI